MCMKDAGLNYEQNVKAAVVGYCYGEPTCGQRAIYQMGHTGIPIFNTNNNCSTGSSAIFLGRSLLETGAYDCVLALGFEKMKRHLSSVYTDLGWSTPMEKHYEKLYESDKDLKRDPVNKGMNDWTSNVVKMFALAAVEHQKKYGTSDEVFAKISYKNHRHSVNNPYARNQKEYSMEEIKNSGKLMGPLTSAQACPTGDGAAAVLLCSEKFLLEHPHLQKKAVEILHQEMATDFPSSFSENPSMIALCGSEMTRRAAERVYKNANIGPKDLDVLEVHDCFSSNELIVMESLGLCKEGEGGKLIEQGKWTKNSNGGESFKIGDRWVINPSGGLESKGHPISATGIAQCIELCWQLRGEAGKRQIEGAKIALQHNLGLGSAVVVTAYRKWEPKIQAKL
eukprot:TRINITY_DN4951_c0_g1_i1.p1 TRINITY_DN4951_c0_g1~~TRINITY_DN4951_c0_g1_i1.p1  ORF type:complete len:445 (-),score=124.27 TRINITY_DN4951_c0_g1_i1:53-1237(-)